VPGSPASGSPASDHPASDRRPARRLALVLAADPADPATAGHAAAELRHLRRTLGDGATDGYLRTAPAVNPLADQGGMMASSPVGVCLDLGLADDLGDAALLGALDGFAARHPGVFAAEGSAVLVGPVHRLRERPLTAHQRATAIRVIVAVRPRAGLTAERFRAGWLRAGTVNQRNHPTCSAYAQQHADTALTMLAARCLGLPGAPFAGLAIEVFGGPADLRVGHHWARSPESVDGTPEPAAHLMELLGRYLDFAGALTFVATENPDSYP